MYSARSICGAGTSASLGSHATQQLAPRSQWSWRMSRIIVFLFFAGCRGQHSVVRDSEALLTLHASNKFFHRAALNASQLEETVFGIDAADAHPSGSQGCSLDIQLAWTTKLGASLYSTPHIVPAGGLGGRDIWASAFVRFAEAIRGEDGHELAGWPYVFSHSSFHARCTHCGRICLLAHHVGSLKVRIAPALLLTARCRMMLITTALTKCC